MSTDDRLRIAATLLASRDKEGVVRAPLAHGEARALIRSMSTQARANLTSSIDFVQEYEAHERNN